MILNNAFYLEFVSFILIFWLLVNETSFTKVLFTNHCRRQNFCPIILHLVDRLYTVIHKTKNTRTKVLLSATTGGKYFSTFLDPNTSNPFGT